MEIALISQEIYDKLVDIQKANPILTYQNKGYDNFKKSDMTDKDREAVKTIESLLKDQILGFSSFTNFRMTNSDGTGKLGMRIQYNYGMKNARRKDGKITGGDHTELSFIGVGYITLDELLNGFKEKEKA